MTTVDDYIKQMIKKGDLGSAILRRRTASSLRNSEYVYIVKSNGMTFPVLIIPENYMVAVHSTTGDPSERNPEIHARSLVDRLVSQAEKINAKPLGFSNILDSQTGDLGIIEQIANALVEESDKHSVAVLNGENAILNERVVNEANISGTMISLIHKRYYQEGIYYKDQQAYSFFDPEGKAVYINSDGIGTKMEFYERSKEYGLAYQDFFAMVLDDCVKKGAIPKSVSAVSEFNTHFGSIFHYLDHAKRIAEEIGFLFTNQYSEAGSRIKSYRGNISAYNIGGSVVSVIDEVRLQNPLVPNEEEVIIAIQRQQNPRSNGITDKRQVMTELFGMDWHETEQGALFLEYLARPSTIFYPVFKDLIDEGLASSVYHMSGGAFEGKLAKPLAEQGYFAKLEDLFEPDWREYVIVGKRFISAETAYAKCSMGNEGFVTTSNPSEVLEKLRNDYAWDGRVVGVIEEAKNGKTGIELKEIKGSNGKNVYYSGRN